MCRSTACRCGAWCGVVTIGILFTSFQAAYGDCNFGPVGVSRSQRVFNTHSLMVTATGVQFKYSIESGYVHDCYFDSYNDNIKRDGDPLAYGSVSRETSLDDFGRVWCVTTTYSDVDPPYGVTYGEYVDINASVQACCDRTKYYNTMDLWGVNLEYEEIFKKAHPDTSFEIAGVVEGSEPFHNVVYKYKNLEPEEGGAYIDYVILDFYQAEHWTPPSDPSDQAPGQYIDTDVIVGLSPQDEAQITISVPTMEFSYIFVDAHMEYEMPDFDPVVVPFRDGHEETVVGFIPTPRGPALSKPGLVVLITLLLTCTVIIGRWRRRPAVA